MREVKFRAINKDGGFIYGLPYTARVNEPGGVREFSNRLCWRSVEGERCSQRYRNGTLCQYVGVRDRNNKDIYEGDIIRYSKFSYGGDKEYMDVEVISDMVEWLQEYGYAGEELGYYRSIEVIGDEYHNPELLEGGKG